MVERWFFRPRVGSDQDERVSARDGLAIPESIGIPDPLDLFRNVDGERLVAISHRDRLNIVWDCPLRVCRRRNEQKGGGSNASSQEPAAKSEII
jgi:hypothetical protein